MAELVDGTLFCLLALGAHLVGLELQTLSIQLSFGAISIAYFGYFEGRPAGQTIGKRLVGIRVMDLDTGAPLGWGRAVVRLLARAISALPLALGYVWMLWDPERRTWHDKLSDSVVVPVVDYPIE